MSGYMQYFGVFIVLMSSKIIMEAIQSLLALKIAYFIKQNKQKYPHFSTTPQTHKSFLGSYLMTTSYWTRHG